MPTLAEILAGIDSVVTPGKRRLADLMRNPLAYTQQAFGNVGDNMAQFSQNALRAQEGQDLKRMGSVMGDAPMYRNALSQTTNSLMGVAPIGSVKPAYQGEHRAPMKDSGAPLHKLTDNGIYPDDVYSPMAARYYGSGDVADNQAFALAQRLKDRPNAPVTMYRAVPKPEPSPAEMSALLDAQMKEYLRRGKMPKDAGFSKGDDWFSWAARERDRLASLPPPPPAEKLKINNGDWVAIDRQYAKEHGESALNGNYKILSKTVPARKLFTNGDSIREFGYDESGRILPELLPYLAGVGGAGLLGLNALSEKK